MEMLMKEMAAENADTDRVEIDPRTGAALMSSTDRNTDQLHPDLRGNTLDLIRLSGRNVLNLTLVVAFIDGEARRRRMTRTAFVEWMARRIAQDGG